MVIMTYVLKMVVSAGCGVDVGTQYSVSGDDGTKHTLSGDDCTQCRLCGDDGTQCKVWLW